MSDSIVEIHGFLDASLLVMAAVVYISVRSTPQISQTSLICSNTEVSPVKRLTSPRLKPNAALVLAQLVTHVQVTPQLKMSSINVCTNSRITLVWIKADPLCWKDYVRNRSNTHLLRIKALHKIHFSLTKTPRWLTHLTALISWVEKCQCVLARSYSVSRFRLRSTTALVNGITIFIKPRIQPSDGFPWSRRQHTSFRTTQTTSFSIRSGTSSNTSSLITAHNSHHRPCSPLHIPRRTSAHTRFHQTILLDFWWNHHQRPVYCTVFCTWQTWIRAHHHHAANKTLGYTAFDTALVTALKHHLKTFMEYKLCLILVVGAIIWRVQR